MRGYRTTGAPAPAPANPRHFLGAGAPAPAFFLKNRGLAGEWLFAHNSKSFELIKKIEQILNLCVKGFNLSYVGERGVQWDTGKYGTV